MALSGCLYLTLISSGSNWLSLWLSLALTGSLLVSLLLSNFAYTVLDRLSGPLLGSQRRRHADALSPALITTIASVLFWHEKHFFCSGINNMAFVLLSQ